MFEELPFEEHRFFTGANFQTIMGSFFHFAGEPLSQTKLLTLPDGDKMSLEITTPNGWTDSDKTVVLVHGLCGSHKSTYMIRLANHFQKVNVRTVRLNMRGCGSSSGLAKKPYHMGRSDDVLFALKYLIKEAPNSSITLIGFSMGANVVLKLGGELGAQSKGLLNQIISISPPADIIANMKKFRQPSGRFYEKFFLRSLLKEVIARKKLFPDLPDVEFPKNLTFNHFDDLYTAPLSGFDGATDYYTKSSSKKYVPEIAVKCRILFAKDDPVVDPHLLDDLTLPKNVKLYKTEKGGHLGFFSRKKHGLHGNRWMDHILDQWIFEEA